MGVKEGDGVVMGEERDRERVKVVETRRFPLLLHIHEYLNLIPELQRPKGPRERSPIPIEIGQTKENHA